MAAFEKETVFSLEEAIEYTDGGVISKQLTKSKAGNLTLFSFDKEQGLSEHKTSYDAIVQILDGEASFCQIRVDTTTITKLFSLSYQFEFKLLNLFVKNPRA